MGREIALRDVLDAAARNVEGKFPDRPHVEAAVRETIGHTYNLLGALSEAETHLLRAIALFNATLGPGHLKTLKARRNLARLYSDQDRLAEAEEVGREVLAALEEALGFDDPETLSAKNNLGLA